MRAAGAWVPLVLQVISAARDDFAADQPDCVQEREAGDQEQGRDDRFAFWEKLEAREVKDHVEGERKGDPPAIELLSFLKSNGYQIGLISDCAPDLPELWLDTPLAPYFNVTVFSCLAGMNKGDPEIFQLAIEKLQVKPEKCIYVADGMRQELANAAKLGMHSIQILVPGEINDSPLREEWHGPVISSLQEVRDFLN